MSLTTGLVTFPDQQTIIDRINGNPHKPLVEKPFVEQAFSEGSGILKIAAHFANKTMKRDEIKANIETAIVNGSEDGKKWFEKKSNFASEIASQRNSGNLSEFTKETNRIYQKMVNRDDIIFAIYERILVDVLENKTYTLPPDSPSAFGSWTRPVGEPT